MFELQNLSLGSQFNWLLQLNSSEVTWYITRSAGLVAFVLLWLSTVTGLAITGKAANKFLAPAFTFDFHQVLSLLALGFLGLHASFLGYLMATFHGLFSGTDSSLLTVRLMYVAMALVVVALTVHRIQTARAKPRPAARAVVRKPAVASAVPRNIVASGQ